MAFRKQKPAAAKKPISSKRQSGSLVGVDISNSAVKMVHLSQKGRGYHLEGYSIVPLIKDAITDGKIVDIMAVIGAVRQAWQRQGGSVKNVASALASSSVTFKTFSHPADDIKGIEAAAEFEASQLISVEEVNLDFQVLGESTLAAGDVDILLCAAKKEAVTEREEIFSEAQLKLTTLDVDAFASANAVEFLMEQMQVPVYNQTIAFFDVGSTKTQCLIVRNGRLLYNKEQSIGGYQLTRDIQRKYDFNFEEAEQKKKNNDLPPGYENDVLMPFIDGLSQEIYRSLQFFYSTVNVAQYQQVDRILLAGGSGALPTLEENVQAKTQISTMTVNPFANISTNNNISMKQLVQDAPSMVVAFGLALRRFL